jgi:hypothetical protein
MSNNNNDGNKIWVSLGITKNAGNYESFRIDAGAQLSGENPFDDESWDKLWAKVEAEIEEKLVEANQELSP